MSCLLQAIKKREQQEEQKTDDEEPADDVQDGELKTIYTNDID